MNQPTLVSLNASQGALLLNLKQPMFVHRQLLQLSRRGGEETYFVNYIPPARDSLNLPRNVVYVLICLVLVIVATYAIVGHLIKDLMHDLADWILGPKPVEDESEEGRAEIEEERRLSVSSKLMQKDGLEMKFEKDGHLPGIHWGDSSRCLPIPPPLRNALSPSYPEDKNVTAHRMSFSSPLTPYVTSL